MGATKRNGGIQKGAQDHSEGDHGDKTKAAIHAAWNNPPNGDAEHGPQETHETKPQDEHDMKNDGRLFDYHPQHDEADINSEKTRRARKEEREHEIPRDQWSEESVRASAKRKS